MAKRETIKYPTTENSNKFELESVMKFQELPLNVAIKMLKDSGTMVSDEEAAEILLFFHTVVKITIKEFLSPED
ncbi:hypothetical protein [Chryseobacterium sp. FH1]|uniref:hypothetical protein n=1 Tax=Chryseobacterium sp. FH1 TaxID=1233951 RepID=UPI0004E2FD90|nr:hypothetical protein [Chryseobacterium sp. FH1]KFC20720.1 hypothetical protein IO90_16435 [Chryseobacterium sp. FH1]